MGHTKSSTIPETLVPMFACQLPDIRMGIVSEAVERAEEIPAIRLGEMDVRRRFRIPQKLYGRERQIAALLAIR